MEEKPWYEGVPAYELDKLYEESVNRIKSAVRDSSMSFDQASGLVEVEDEALRASILDDALKVLIAEMHFSGGTSLEDLARTLKLPPARLRKAKDEMLRDVEQAAVDKYRTDMGSAGNA